MVDVMTFHNIWRPPWDVRHQKLNSWWDPQGENDGTMAIDQFILFCNLAFIRTETWTPASNIVCSGTIVQIGSTDIFIEIVRTSNEGCVTSNPSTIALDDENISSASGGYANYLSYP
jgi:hypothetical protein